MMNESDFEAKPSVLMLGQYSSGKLRGASLTLLLASVASRYGKYGLYG